jgi:hypothetical protein
MVARVRSCGVDVSGRSSGVSGGGEAGRFRAFQAQRAPVPYSLPAGSTSCIISDSACGPEVLQVNRPPTPAGLSLSLIMLTAKSPVPSLTHMLFYVFIFLTHMPRAIVFCDSPCSWLGQNLWRSSQRQKRSATISSYINHEQKIRHSMEILRAISYALNLTPSLRKLFLGLRRQGL